MQNPRLPLVASVILFVFMLVPLQSQGKAEIGKFREAACPFPLSDIDDDPAYKIFSDGISMSGMGGEYFIEANKIWKLKKLDPARVSYPGARDVPVMVVNGKYDSVIPVKYDEVMKRDLSNCYIYRFDGVTHSAFDNATPCVLPMFLQFLADPSKAPDSSCMDNYKQVYLLE